MDVNVPKLALISLLAVTIMLLDEKEPAYADEGMVRHPIEQTSLYQITLRLKEVQHELEITTAQKNKVDRAREKYNVQITVARKELGRDPGSLKGAPPGERMRRLSTTKVAFEQRTQKICFDVALEVNEAFSPKQVVRARELAVQYFLFTCIAWEFPSPLAQHLELEAQQLVKIEEKRLALRSKVKEQGEQGFARLQKEMLLFLQEILTPDQREQLFQIQGEPHQWTRK